MAAPIYVNGAIVIYNSLTGTIEPTASIVLDTTNQSAAFPLTQMTVPAFDGMYLLSVYLHLQSAASGGASQSSTIGPMQATFTCADCDVPITLALSLTQNNGSVSPTNTNNSLTNGVACGSIVINTKAGQPIAVACGYASSGSTPACVATCTLTSAAWNVAGIEVRGTPVYVGGNGVSQSGGATTETVTYSPTAGNATVLYFATGSAITGLTVKDNLGNTLSTGPTSGLLTSFYQYPVPSGVTSYVATWTTARQSSFIVEEYSGVTAVNAALSGNTASGSSNTATLTVTDDEAGDTTVFGFYSANILTASVGNQRHQVTGSTARLTTVDNSAGSPMTYALHAKLVYIGGTSF